MATILDRFTALWGRRNTALPVVTAPEVKPTAPATVTFTAQRDRRSKITDSRDMVAEDPRPKQALATLARDATKGGFTLQISGPRADQAQAAADALFARVKLPTRIDDWARLTFRDGDTFLELGVAANGEVVEITRKPTLEMYRWSDDFDRFYDPAAAFYWTDRPTFNDVPPADATFFPEWQIIHARWDRDEGSRYGTPMFPRLARRISACHKANSTSPSGARPAVDSGTYTSWMAPALLKSRRTRSPTSRRWTTRTQRSAISFPTGLAGSRWSGAMRT
jgi:hypothetical protein